MAIFYNIELLVDNAVIGHKVWKWFILLAEGNKSFVFTYHCWWPIGGYRRQLVQRHIYWLGVCSEYIINILTLVYPFIGNICGISSFTVKLLNTTLTITDNCAQSDISVDPSNCCENQLYICKSVFNWVCLSVEIACTFLWLYYLTIVSLVLLTQFIFFRKSIKQTIGTSQKWFFQQLTI